MRDIRFYSHIVMLTPPAHLLPWLTYTDYLTHRLRERAGDTVLQVLSEQWCDASTWDRQILKVTLEKVMHRDIVMLAGGKPCWYARTILPETTYQSDVTLFARLQQEPLGNLIFQSGAIQRATLTYYAISPTSVEYHWLPQSLSDSQKVLWLRLSTFQLCRDLEKLFCLVEIVLPELENYCE